MTWSPALGTTPPARGRTLSADEWAALPEDDDGELIDGRIAEEEVPDAIHELTITWLVAVFRAWLGKDGFVFGSELKLLLRADRGRKPDIAVYLPGRPPPPRRGALSEPPDIVVEVVSPTPKDERRDRVEKMADYAQFGVRTYCLLDPALGAFEVFQLGDDGRYVRALGATEGRADVPGAPGLSLDLDALWAELARLGPE